jgi:negative regulator of flagellin synthesis FlgM
MKIDRNVTYLNNVADKSTHLSAKDGVNAKRSAPEMPGVASQVQLTSPSSFLHSTSGDIDAARVAKIRENISAGRYHVDTTKIADGLLASVRDLLGAKVP